MGGGGERFIRKTKKSILLHFFFVLELKLLDPSLGRSTAQASTRQKKKKKRKRGPARGLGGSVPGRLLLL
jgi:hypothetical protein